MKESAEQNLQAKNLPLDVAVECLTLRDSRRDIDVVKDPVEEELHKEVQIIDATKKALQQKISQAFEKLWYGRQDFPCTQGCVLKVEHMYCGQQATCSQAAFCPCPVSDSPTAWTWSENTSPNPALGSHYQLIGSRRDGAHLPPPLTTCA